MLATALIFLVRTAADFFTGALLLRFLLQWARASQRNPLSDFVIALTNFAVRPARRVIPGWGGLDLSTLVLAWLTQFAAFFIMVQLGGDALRLIGGASIAALMLIALVNVVRILLYIIMIVVIVQAVMSWVNPYSPIAPMLNTLTRPFLRPFQRLIPPVANVDLSPIFVIVACQLLLILLAHIA